jgi:hypothetical protein
MCMRPEATSGERARGRHFLSELLVRRFCRASCEDCARKWTWTSFAPGSTISQSSTRISQPIEYLSLVLEYLTGSPSPPRRPLLLLLLLPSAKSASLLLEEACSETLFFIIFLGIFLGGAVSMYLYIHISRV